MRRSIYRLAVSAFVVAILFAGTGAFAGEKVLYSFEGGNSGNDPEFGVVFDQSGNAYGTTTYGGIYGWGTVFELKPSKDGWDHVVLYSFKGSSDGEYPEGNLLIDANGNLYGTTPSGGTSGGGTVFQMHKQASGWKHVVLYNFCSQASCSDGEQPGGLTFDKSGNLYGTTVNGGNRARTGGCGIVYELSLSEGSWKETVLYVFTDKSDGCYPNPGVAFGKTGSIYGTTVYGGGYDYGTIFLLKPGKRAWTFSPLYAFDGLQNHRSPNGYLSIDAAGSIIGTTSGYYNCNPQCGSVYRLARVNDQWLESDVYLFDGTHGADPNPPLLMDTAGNFYGSANGGGSNEAGVVFQLQPGKVWSINVIYEFSGAGEDRGPNSGLVFGPSGELVGTTGSPYYGEEAYGEVYALAP